MKKIICLLGLILLVLTACHRDEATSNAPPPARPTNLQHSRTELLMGGPIEVRIADIECSDAYEDVRCSLVDTAFELIFEMERRFTVNDTGGEVEEINAMAGISPVVVQSDTFYLIEQAIFYSIYSDRLFNATIGPLTSLWNIGMPGSRRPTEAEIEAVLPLLDPKNVILDAEAQTVFLSEPNMRLDLGAIAKGYMADIIAELLLENGVERALLIVGGDVLAIGGRSGGEPLRIGIRNPFFDNDEATDNYLIGTLPAYNQAVVTSGTYNRYFVDHDTQTFYHHIFDSTTGMPFNNDISSISIIADTGLLGEVYSTIIFAMGIEAGLAYVENHPRLEVMFVSADRGIYLSSGLLTEFNLMLTEEFSIRTP